MAVGIAVRGDDDLDRLALLEVGVDQTSEAQDLVVGMRHDDEQALVS